MDNQTVPSDRILLSSREVAQLIGRSLITLERWRRKKIGPPFVRTAGNRIGYRRASLDAWLAAQEVAS